MAEKPAKKIETMLRTAAIPFTKELRPGKITAYRLEGDPKPLLVNESRHAGGDPNSVKMLMGELGRRIAAIHQKREDDRNG